MNSSLAPPIPATAPGGRKLPIISKSDEMGTGTPAALCGSSGSISGEMGALNKLLGMGKVRLRGVVRGIASGAILLEED